MLKLYYIDIKISLVIVVIISYKINNYFKLNYVIVKIMKS